MIPTDYKITVFFLVLVCMFFEVSLINLCLLLQKEECPSARLKYELVKAHI